MYVITHSRLTSQHIDIIAKVYISIKPTSTESDESFHNRDGICQEVVEVDVTVVENEPGSVGCNDKYTQYV